LSWEKSSPVCSLGLVVGDRSMVQPDLLMTSRYLLCHMALYCQ
jgi:hypothetical protein